MPGGDRTGPAAMGPMTGRGAGYCSGYSMPGGFHRPFGRGYGLGFGFRGGRGPYGGGPWSGYDNGASFGGVTREQEKDALQRQAAFLEETLKGLQQRIAEIEKEQKKK